MENFYCKRCEEYVGYFTNNEGDCEEICGDGIMAGQKPCDDNNTKSGDGCSATCDLEFGYECNVGGTLRCRETIPP